MKHCRRLPWSYKPHSSLATNQVSSLYVSICSVSSNFLCTGPCSMRLSTLNTGKRKEIVTGQFLVFLAVLQCIENGVALKVCIQVPLNLADQREGGT